LPGVERIWMPGEQSAKKREAYGRDGIPLNDGLVESLDLFADELQMERLAR
jgi:LDH2 family malate/lactate/ureidoglycolate dehydrogenase